MPAPTQMGGSHMTTIRIAVASLLAAAALLAGGGVAQHNATAVTVSASHNTPLGGPVECCDD